MDISPTHSNCGSVSMDESMSTCSSSKSPEVELGDCLEMMTCSNLFMIEPLEEVGEFYFYKHLRESEEKKRPCTDFMDSVQNEIDTHMRAVLVDWLVVVLKELSPETLYLTINYIDRYLSANNMDSQRLKLLGVACMMIAAKYEEIRAPQLKYVCDITENTYTKDDVLHMESSVLNFFKFEMTAPTVKCFLSQFVLAALPEDEDTSLIQHVECLANYIAELSLLEYNMLCYAPSVIAASAIFLAKYIVSPTKRPWNSTLLHCTLYQPSELRYCVNDLHNLCRNSKSSVFEAIREKYSQRKYKSVAKNYCPPSIPMEFFQKLS